MPVCSFSRGQTGFLFPDIPRWKCGSRKPAEKPEAVRKKLSLSFASPQKTLVRKRSRSPKQHQAVRSRTAPIVFARTIDALEPGSRSVRTRDLQVPTWRTTRERTGHVAPHLLIEIVSSIPFLNSLKALSNFYQSRQELSPCIASTREEMMISPEYADSARAEIVRCSAGPSDQETSPRTKNAVLFDRRSQGSDHGWCVVRERGMLGFHSHLFLSISENRRSQFLLKTETNRVLRLRRMHSKNLFDLPRQKPFSVSNKSAFSLFAMGFSDRMVEPLAHSLRP